MGRSPHWGVCNVRRCPLRGEIAYLSGRGRCKQRGDRLRLEGNKNGGQNCTGDKKRKAGGEGGKISRLTPNRAARNGRGGAYHQRTKRQKRNKVPWWCPADLTVKEFFDEQEAIDRRRAANRKAPWTENVVLEAAFFERCRRMRDHVSAEIRAAVAGFSLGDTVRVVFGVRFTQSARGAAQQLAEALRISEKCFEQELAEAKCGNGTHRGVVPRTEVARVARAVASTVTRKPGWANLEAFAMAIAEAVRRHKGSNRICFFHSAQVAFDLTSLPLGLNSNLADRGCKAPVLTGSRKGLRAVRACEGGKPTLTSVAQALGVGEKIAQTTLCAYSKYVRWYNWGITCWRCAAKQNLTAKL